MSLNALDVFRKEGAKRIGVEILLVFVLVTLAYLFIVEPILRSIAPTVYAQPGLNYNGRDLPDTAAEATHMFLAVAFGGLHLFWRLNHTELGERFKQAVMEGY